MSDVRSAVRALKIFEAFAARGCPMTLSELASTLEMPTSSCLLLIRTLLARGYLYATGRRSAYYPTRRLFDVGREIARNDPILDRFEPHLDRLREATRETVTLAKRQGSRLIYLAVAESREVVRVIATPGVLRPLHSTATGKALLSALSDSDRKELFADIALERLTDRTISSVDDLELAITKTRQRGYAVNSGEAVADLSAVSVAIVVDDDTYAITVMGPSHRLDPMMEKFGAALNDYRQVIEADLSARPGKLAAGDG